MIVSQYFNNSGWFGMFSDYSEFRIFKLYFLISSLGVLELNDLNNPSSLKKQMKSENDSSSLLRIVNKFLSVN